MVSVGGCRLQCVLLVFLLLLFLLYSLLLLMHFEERQRCCFLSIALQFLLLIALLSLLEQERLCAAPLVGLQCFLRSAFIGLSWKGEKFHFMGGCKIVGWKCF